MCKSQPTDDKPSLIGTWSGHVTHYKFLGSPIISLERLNLMSSNFVHSSWGSNRMDDISPHHVTVLKFCRLSWCSASRGFVSDSWATCFISERELSSCSLYAIAGPSVCLSSVCLSVTFVHLTQPVEMFGNVSSVFAIWHHGYPLTSAENCTDIVPE